MPATSKESKKTSTYYIGIGRRKSAIARVRIFSGKGKVIVNDKEVNADKIILQPLIISGQQGKFDITVKVSGGGMVSQLEAIRLGVSRALVTYDNDLRPTLRKSGFMTRDPREKERKKPGLKRARKAPQWQKR